MSMNIQRVIIVQDASKELSAIFMRHVLRGSSLNSGDKLKVLGIVQAFTKNDRFYPLGCTWLKQRRKLHSSSATINKHKANIEEETQEMLQQYLSCPEYKEIVRMAEILGVEFEIAVEAGSLNEVAVEYVKSFQATHMILHRQLQKELKYFTENLSCGISRMKHDNTLEIIRPPEANDLRLITYQDSSKQCNVAFKDPTCSLCMNIRPWDGLRKRFTYAELQLATNGFPKQNSIPDLGKKTYLGLLNDQRTILIREHCSATMKEEDFMKEVQILETIKHENVTLLLGSCSEGPHRFLVYEYVCNGSLNKHLSSEGRILTWDSRVKIIFGAAKGLEYLHRQNIYGSMRPSNIILTHDFQPLISYYGLTCNQYEDLWQSSETTVLKTFEYLAPEYEETGRDLSKADVYSFGVVLLELITGRKTIEETHGQSFLRWARPLLRDKAYMDLVDRTIHESVDVYQLYWLVRVADKCLSWNPKNRCSMEKVANTLKRVVNRCAVEDFSPTECELNDHITR